MPATPSHAPFSERPLCRTIDCSPAAVNTPARRPAFSTSPVIASTHADAGGERPVQPDQTPMSRGTFPLKQQRGEDLPRQCLVDHRWPRQRVRRGSDRRSPGSVMGRAALRSHLILLTSNTFPNSSFIAWRSIKPIFDQCSQRRRCSGLVALQKVLPITPFGRRRKRTRSYIFRFRSAH